MTDIIEFLYKIASAPWWVYLMVFAWFCWAVYYNQNKEITMNGENNGLQRMPEAARENSGGEETGGGENRGGEESMEVEASGDTLVIAGAIHDLADAIRGYAKVMAAENGMDDGEVEETYLDGSRK